MTLINLDGLDLSQLETLQGELRERKLLNNEAITSIKDQLDQEQKRVTNGYDYDWRWWRRAKAALRHKGQTDQQLGMQLSVVTARIRTLQHIQTTLHGDTRKVTFYHAFFEMARAKLASEVFEELCKSAQRIADATGDEQ